MILHGDVTDKLKEIETESVQCVVTSPPYWGLRDYGTASWEGGNKDCNHFDGTLQSMKTTLHPETNQNDKRNFTGMPFKDVCGKCGAKRVDKQLGLEETPELYVENMVNVFREIKRVLKDDGTCWLNLGDSYYGGGWKGASLNKNSGDIQKAHKGTHCGEQIKHDPKHPIIKTKDLVGIPWRVALALQSDGWWLRQDIIWHKPNPMPESVTDRCTKSHEYIFLLSKSAKYFYDNDAIAEQSLEYGKDKRSDLGNIRYDGKRTLDKSGKNGQGSFVTINQTRNKRSVWTINTQPYKEAHFAVFPPKIPELCIKAGSKEGDTVLDPFFGSGTTGWVAQRLGRKWIGIELNAEYIKIAKQRFIQRELFT